MMSPLAITLATALLLAPDRIPVDCSVSAKAGGVSAGEDDVTAVRCAGRDGFFVPSSRYRSMSRTEVEAVSLREETEILDAEVRELRGAVGALVKTASASAEIAGLYRKAYLDTGELWRAAEEDAERRWYESPGIWVGVGVAVTVATVLAFAEILPERVISR